MSNIIDKLKETGVNVDLIMRLPSFGTSGLLIFSVIIASLLSNGWIEFITYFTIMLAWMLGVFVGFKIFLLRIELIDKESSNEQGG